MRIILPPASTPSILPPHPSGTFVVEPNTTGCRKDLPKGDYQQAAAVGKGGVAAGSRIAVKGGGQSRKAGGAAAPPAAAVSHKISKRGMEPRAPPPLNEREPRMSNIRKNRKGGGGDPPEPSMRGGRPRAIEKPPVPAPIRASIESKDSFGSSESVGIDFRPSLQSDASWNSSGGQNEIREFLAREKEALGEIIAGGGDGTKTALAIMNDQLIDEEELEPTLPVYAGPVCVISPMNRNRPPRITSTAKSQVLSPTIAPPPSPRFGTSNNEEDGSRLTDASRMLDIWRHGKPPRKRRFSEAPDFILRKDIDPAGMAVLESMPKRDRESIEFILALKPLVAPDVALIDYLSRVDTAKIKALLPLRQVFEEQDRRRCRQAAPVPVSADSDFASFIIGSPSTYVAGEERERASSPKVSFPNIGDSSRSIRLDAPGLRPSIPVSSPRIKQLKQTLHPGQWNLTDVELAMLLSFVPNIQLVNSNPFPSRGCSWLEGFRDICASMGYFDAAFQTHLATHSEAKPLQLLLKSDRAVRRAFLKQLGTAFESRRFEFHKKSLDDMNARLAIWPFCPESDSIFQVRLPVAHAAADAVRNAISSICQAYSEPALNVKPGLARLLEAKHRLLALQAQIKRIESRKWEKDATQSVLGAVRIQDEDSSLPECTSVEMTEKSSATLLESVYSSLYVQHYVKRLRAKREKWQQFDLEGRRQLARNMDEIVAKERGLCEKQSWEIGVSGTLDLKQVIPANMAEALEKDKLRCGFEWNSKMKIGNGWDLRVVPKATAGMGKASERPARWSLDASPPWLKSAGRVSGGTHTVGTPSAEMESSLLRRVRGYGGGAIISVEQLLAMPFTPLPTEELRSRHCSNLSIVNSRDASSRETPLPARRT